MLFGRSCLIDGFIQKHKIKKFSVMIKWLINMIFLLLKNRNFLDMSKRYKYIKEQQSRRGFGSTYVCYAHFLFVIHAIYPKATLVDMMI